MAILDMTEGGASMEVEIRIEPGRQEPKAVILAGEESEDLRRLAERLSELALGDRKSVV